MKIAIAFVAALTLGLSQAFTASPSRPVMAGSTTQLASTLDRRQMVQQTLACGVAIATAAPQVAWAGDYVPKFDDLKQIYYLGMSLDKLIAKFSDPDTIEAGLDGVRLFNKDINFYPGYAKNYVLKLIKKGGDSDARVGYIRQACTLVGSTETLLAGGLADKAAQDEAIGRIKKAQALIGKFLVESGVKDEKIDAYVASH